MLALRGGRVVAEPRAPSTWSTVVVDGDSISAVDPAAAIPATAQIVDCSGCTVLAGFWNSHVHFFERKWSDAAGIPREELDAQLQGFLRYGFTTVFDLSSEFDNTAIIRRRIESREVRGPRIFTTGEGIVPAGFELPDVAYAVLGQTKVTLPQVSNADEAREATVSLLERHVDAVKLFASTPSGVSLATEVMSAAVAVAHDAGVPVFVHPNTEDDIMRAVQARVDIIAHTTPRSGPWTPALRAAMAGADVALTPTLSLWQHFTKHDRVSVQRRQIANATSQLRDWNSDNGAILFGTDFGAVDADPKPEYLLMAAAGMTFDDILASLTTTPAARFGAAESLGRIAKGFQADLTIVRGDPSQDIVALADVAYVVRDGVLTPCQDR